MNKNKCYIAREQNAVVKVLTTKEKVLQEIEGISVFSDYVVTPRIEQIDQRTVELSLINGEVVDVQSDAFNHQIISLFEMRFEKPLIDINHKLSIFSKIKDFKIVFKDYPKVLALLKRIERNLQNKPLFPVHGDLQKQNIFITKNKLSLIDYEHFIYAPLELDIVNSLFFNDRNCLRAEKLIPVLVKKGLFNQSLLKDMLCYYSIYQLTEGRDVSDVLGKYKTAIRRLKKIFPVERIILSSL